MEDKRIRPKEVVCPHSDLPGDLVSVIVPIYKVEKYLKRCIDSILKQTYTNLQIILVDDGSPDQCGSICDEYALRDDRIIVIHQENRGLAAARNTGLAAVSGEWIAWVDSDDWVESDFIYSMLSEAIANHADIVICGHYKDYIRKTVYIGVNTKQYLSTKQAIPMLLQDNEIRNYMWDKLWRAELFRTIRFPEGQTFEDIAVCYKLFLKAQSIVILPEPYYHYTMRKDSIIYDDSIHNMLSRLKACLDRHAELIDLYPDDIMDKMPDQLRAVISLKGNYCRYKIYKNKEYADLLNTISKYYRTHPIDKKTMMNEGLAGRIIIKLIPYNSWWSHIASGLIGWLYKVKNGTSL